jgi:hypothetical protein
MQKKRKLQVEITEMFMAKSDALNSYYGIIKRGKDDKGNPFVFSRIIMPDGMLCSGAMEQIELGENLDKLCFEVCERNLHGNAGISTKIFGADFFFN